MRKFPESTEKTHTPMKHTPMIFLHFQGRSPSISHAVSSWVCVCVFWVVVLARGSPQLGRWLPRLGLNSLPASGKFWRPSQLHPPSPSPPAPCLVTGGKNHTCSSWGKNASAMKRQIGKMEQTLRKNIGEALPGISPNESVAEGACLQGHVVCRKEKESRLFAWACRRKACSRKLAVEPLPISRLRRK